MDIISYIHKSVELLFQILGLPEIWTRRTSELSPFVATGSLLNFFLFFYNTRWILTNKIMRNKSIYSYKNVQTLVINT
jgi:hypothetical protein